MTQMNISLYNSAPPTSFIVTFSKDLEKIDNQKSKARVRIFYRGLNRNGTYITEDLTEELIATLPGTPIVGDYDKEKGDFTQHMGVEKTKGYGFVPLDMNFAWETHEDPDGVEREYACCDVILWTGRYDEAAEIIEKTQSMELDPDTIEGTWKISQGVPVFTFSKAEFFGLCVLGDDCNPCFEGSSFYTLDNYQKQAIKEMRSEYADHLKLFTTTNNKGGESMAKPIINFRLSHRDVFDKLWEALNPNYNSEGNWTCDVGIIDVYDDYALIRDYADDKCRRQNYTKNDADNTIVLGEAVEVFIVDVTAEEYSALQYIKEVSGSFAETQVLVEKATAYQAANPEFTFDLAPVTPDADPTDGDGADGADGGADDGAGDPEPGADDTGAGAEPAATDFNVTETAEYKALESEIASLREYKATKESNEKAAILAVYSERLPDDVLATYTEDKVGGLTPDQLEKELAYSLVKTTDFALTGPARPLIPTGNLGQSPIVSLLSNYVQE